MASLQDTDLVRVSQLELHPGFRDNIQKWRNGARTVLVDTNHDTHCLVKRWTVRWFKNLWSLA